MWERFAPTSTASLKSHSIYVTSRSWPQTIEPTQTLAAQLQNLGLDMSGRRSAATVAPSAAVAAAVAVAAAAAAVAAVAAAVAVIAVAAAMAKIPTQSEVLVSWLLVSCLLNATLERLRLRQAGRRQEPAGLRNDLQMTLK